MSGSRGAPSVPDGAELARWLARLVQVPSVTPDQAGARSGAAGERPLAEAVAGWLEELGGDVDVVEALPGRPNVFGRFRGRSERWLAIDVHVDTVGVEGMRGDPFSGAVAGGRVHGRGAVDTKASLAVVLALLAQLRASGGRPRANLLVAATVDEEATALGAPAAARWLQERGIAVDELVVGEPTGCVPVYGNRGVVRQELVVPGRAAHASQPERGENAIVAAGRAVAALAAEHARLRGREPGPLGSPSLTVTTIAGGAGLNVVPEACTIGVDRRLAAGERAEPVSAELRLLVERACGAPVELRVDKAVDPFLQDRDAPFVRALERWSGRPAATVEFGSNAFAYTEAADGVVVFGPGSIDQAHRDEEWVEVAELTRAAAVHARWWGVA